MRKIVLAFLLGGVAAWGAALYAAEQSPDRIRLVTEATFLNLKIASEIFPDTPQDDLEKLLPRPGHLLIGPDTALIRYGASLDLVSAKKKLAQDSVALATQTGDMTRAADMAGRYQRLDTLEYRLADMIVRLSDPDKPHAFSRGIFLSR